MQNDAEASIRKLAQTYGRNEDVAESLRRPTPTSITAEEALDQGVIDLIAPTTDDLLAQLDGRTVTLATGQTVTLHTANATIEEEPIGAFMGFLHSLLDPNLAFIFFWLGLGLIVLELIVPGHIFSGTIGTILLIIALVSFGVLPVRIIGIALLVLSVIAFVIELHAPGLGIWGAIGLVALLLGGWFLYDRSGGVAGLTRACSGRRRGLRGACSSASSWPRRCAAARTAGASCARSSAPRASRCRSGVGPDGGQVRVAAEQWRASPRPARSPVARRSA